MSIGKLFPAGTGCMIEPGMKPGKTVPEDYGMKSYVLQSIDAVARKGLEAGAYPGCRVLVWKDGLPVYDKGFGTHSDKDTTTVRSSDLFDLASLTKTTATLLAVMKLYDEGKIKLDDKVSAYLLLAQWQQAEHYHPRTFVPRIGASSLYPLLPGHHRPEFGTRSVLPELGGRVASYAGKRA